MGTSLNYMQLPQKSPVQTLGGLRRGPSSWMVFKSTEKVLPFQPAQPGCFPLAGYRPSI